MIDRKKFYAEYKNQFGALSQEQVDALNLLLKAVDTHDSNTDVRHLAYIFATVMHETARTYKPLKEYGRGRGRRYGKATGPYGHAYYGRGYVQLTWDYNYKKQAAKLGIDFYKHPDLVMEPENAYRILVEGMKDGDFTGKGLDRYINDSNTDYYTARKIVNGLDKAGTIAGYARKFQKIFEYSI